MRFRILAGTILLVVFLAVYAALVAVVGTRLLPDRTGILLAFYAAAGIAWIWPAALLTRWMSRTAPYHPPPGAST